MLLLLLLLLITVAVAVTVFVLDADIAFVVAIVFAKYYSFSSTIAAAMLYCY